MCINRVKVRIFGFLLKQNQSQEYLDSISVLEVARALLIVLELLPSSTSLRLISCINCTESSQK